jgi:predicted transcriptional regulator
MLPRASSHAKQIISDISLKLIKIYSNKKSSKIQKKKSEEKKRDYRKRRPKAIGIHEENTVEKYKKPQHTLWVQNKKNQI